MMRDIEGKIETFKTPERNERAAAESPSTQTATKARGNGPGAKPSSPWSPAPEGAPAAPLDGQ